MAYAKKCRDCDVQVIWDDSIVPAPGSNNKFKEVKTNLPHANRCQGKQQEQLQSQQSMQPTTATYKYEQPMQKQGIYAPMKQEQQPPIDDFKLAQLITKVDNLNIGLAKVMSMIQTLNDLSMNAEDISRLRTENAELKDVLKNREDNFVPANKVQSEAEHVQNMVQKGKDEEELEI